MKNQKKKKETRAKNTRDDDCSFFFSLCVGVFGKRTREREKDFLRENPLRTTLRTGGGAAAASAGGGREDKIQLLREAKKETSSSRQ